MGCLALRPPSRALQSISRGFGRNPIVRLDLIPCNGAQQPIRWLSNGEFLVDRSLRDRRSDIPLLVRHWLPSLNATFGRRVRFGLMSRQEVWNYIESTPFTVTAVQEAVRVQAEPQQQTRRPRLSELTPRSDAPPL